MALADPTTQASFRIATPGNWFDIRLPQGAAAEDELAARLADAWPEETTSGNDLRGIVHNLVSAAAALDVLCAYATLVNGYGRLLPASLVINTFPLGDLTLDQLAEQLSGTDGSLAPRLARVVDLPAGRAVRTEQLREWDVSAGGRQPVSLLVQYVAEVPGRGQALVLTFSTSALGLAEQLGPLFHSIASTLRFDVKRSDLERSEPTDQPR
jgi:hypothetical protein